MPTTSTQGPGALRRALEEYEGSRFERWVKRGRRYGTRYEEMRWRLTDYAGKFVPELAEDVREDAQAPPSPLPLWAWQREALAAWRTRERRGVVEAVTGAGKTRVGIAAACEQLWAGGQVTVLVPRVVLVTQWASHLEDAMPGLRVAQRHGGERGDARADVLVTTVQSAIRDDAVLARRGLLIADECHRYGAETFARGLFDGCAARLGLTATYDRLDDGLRRYLDPYFGGVCFRLSYERAVPEGIVAPFTVAVVKVRLSPDERVDYEDAQAEASDARQRLIQLGAPEEPFGEFLKVVGGWAQAEIFNEATLTARRYMKAFSFIRDILAGCSAKFDVLAKLAPAVKQANGTLVFTQRIEAADTAWDVLLDEGISAAPLHSDMLDADRQRVFKRFERGHLEAVVAVQVLDEGVDLPEADLAIVLAGTQVERQMIQRMGRVLRRKQDGRIARFALVVAEDTSEDPLSGGHEGFLNRITDVAVAVRSYRPAETERVVQLLSTLELPEAYSSALDALRTLSDLELDLLEQLARASVDHQRLYDVARHRFPHLVDALIGVEGVELGDGEAIRIPGSMLADIARLGAMLKKGRQESRHVNARHDRR